MTTFQPAPEGLKRQINEYMAKNKGKLYHKIPHPEFEHLPVAHKEERFSILQPHLEYEGGTVIDIGTHWGQFALWLEELGYQVRAIEHSPKYASIALGIRDICGRKFEVVQKSIFDVEDVSADIVLALNIFHHFLKTEESYNNLVKLLHRIDAKLMFFQSHDPADKQMEGAYANMDQDNFVQFVARESGYSDVTEIGAEGKRRIFKLKRSH